MKFFLKNLLQEVNFEIFLGHLFYLVRLVHSVHLVYLANLSGGKSFKKSAVGCSIGKFLVAGEKSKIFCYRG